MGKVLRYSAYILLFILYIYSIKFTFFPLTGKVVMAILGLFVWLIDFMKREFNISKYDLRILAAGGLLVVWGFMVVMVNGSGQIIYLDYFISLASAFFASYLLYKTTKRDIKSIDTLLWIIALSVFIESLITLGIRFSPSLQNFMFSLQEFQTRDVDDQDLLNINRFVGLGEAVYFGVLPSCTIGLVSLISLIIYNKKQVSSLLCWTMFVVITVVSFVVARYSVAIAVLCMGWYVYILLKKGQISKILLFVAISLAGVLVIFTLLKLYLPEGVFAWAFEMLDGGDSSTANELKDWFSNTAFSVKSFLIGDGLYTNSDGSYYGDIDIGIYRQIYYAGVIGLFLLYFLHRQILKGSYRYLPTRQMKDVSFLLIVSFVIIMLKGDKSIFDLLMIYYVYARYSKFNLTNNNGEYIYKVN